MKKYILAGCLTVGCLLSTAHATPITYSAEGIAAYEEITIDENGVGHVSYNEVDLWGAVTFDDGIEVQTLDKTYYTYTMLSFEISTGQDTWTGSTGFLHWEGDDSMDQSPAFQEIYMAGFLGWFSQFSFYAADGSPYPTNNMTQWMSLPPQIGIWSDNLFNTDASYVSFTLYAPDQSYPVPEPSTLILLSGGVIGIAGMRSRKKKKERNLEVSGLKKNGAERI